MTNKKRAVYKPSETHKPERHAFKFRMDQKTSNLEAGTFKGIASVFGSVVDTYPNPTVIDPGAFAKTIMDSGKQVKILFNHDSYEGWIGLPTMLEETEEGLVVEVSLNQTRRGQDIANALRHAAAIGRLDAVELSIGFDAMVFEMVEEPEEKITYRHITEVRLWEISVVNFGADRQTLVTEAASLQPGPSPEGTPDEPSPTGTLTTKELEQYTLELVEAELRFPMLTYTGGLST